MQDINNLEKFNNLIKSSGLAVAHFWAPWCEPCAFLDKILAQLCADTPSVAGIRVEAEEAPEISEKYSISAVPLFIFFKDGAQVDRLEGADPAGLSSKFTALVSGIATASQPAATGTNGVSASAANVSTVPIRQRIEALLKQQPIMLFMKGTPDAPKCGFSRKSVEALQKVGAQFGHFDILSDEDIRQGLKEYSNWPTYPQLYHKGELLGGNDIILEMEANGELADALK